jgi:hypothetical protein
MEKLEEIIREAYQCGFNDGVGYIYNEEFVGTDKSKIHLVLGEENTVEMLSKTIECEHPYNSVLGDGEMKPAKCLICGKIVS